MSRWIAENFDLILIIAIAILLTGIGISALVVLTRQ